MGRPKQKVSSGPVKKGRPPLTTEARENQMISLAVDLAERQLMDGTASSQVITHYLKLGTMKERQEREKLEEEIKLLKAKTEAIASTKNIEQLYANAIKAIGIYSGRGNQEDYDDEEY